MATSNFITAVSKLKQILRCLLLALLAFTTSSQAQPGIILSQPSAFGPDYVQILATNCTDTNVDYLLASSTNLRGWLPVQINPASASYLPFIIPKPTPPVFYKIVTTRHRSYPTFSMGIVCSSNVNLNGHNFRIDSFDSGTTNYSTAASASPSNNIVLIYDASKAESGGNIGVNGAVVGDIPLGNGSIYGHLRTGPGSASNNVQLGPNGMVGALDWSPTGSPAIEGLGTPQSWWLPNFRVSLPDVATPSFVGLALPGAINGYITLNGGNYIYSTSWSGSSPFMITAPTTLWVKGSVSGLNVVFAGTNASLVLYVGRPATAGDTLSLAGNGTLNSPGYARNLQIFGLPSLTSINMQGNAAWTACIYAPNATAICGGGGNNTQDAAGAIVAKGITLNGHWDFHYDESLKATGPVH
jgi:hypothetical protein